MTTRAIGTEIYRHPRRDVVAIQGDNVVHLSTEDGELNWGDLHGDATADECAHAAAWLVFGIDHGKRMGRVSAKAAIQAHALDLFRSLGIEAKLRSD